MSFFWSLLFLWKFYTSLTNMFLYRDGIKEEGIDKEGGEFYLQFHICLSSMVTHCTERFFFEIFYRRLAIGFGKWYA